MLLDKTTSTVDDILYRDKNIHNIISIGCHVGLKEIWLSRRHPDVHFYCSDIIPFIKIIKQLKINNITFFLTKDLEKIQKLQNLEAFDLVYSNSVIYCISNKKLRDFFKFLSKICKKDGFIVIGDQGNLSFFGIVRHYLIKLSQFRFIFINKKKYKKTGWLRNWKYIKKFIPKKLLILKVDFFDHQKQIPFAKSLKILTWPIYFFSKYIYPISNGSYLFVIRNIK